MARRSFTVSSWTPAAFADTVSYTSNNYMALQGGSGTQRTRIWDMVINGQATVTSPMIMLLARDSTVGATLTALAAGQSDGALDPATAALTAAVGTFVAATTQPQRSATLARLSTGLNANGGIMRLQTYDPDGLISMLGNTASLGEISLSAYTGSTVGAISSSIVFETL